MKRKVRINLHIIDFKIDILQETMHGQSCQYFC
ncbi:hypothetical protein ACROYT_G026610 [Oculina patagonica]